MSGRDDWHQLNNVIKKYIDKQISVRANLTVTPDNVDSLIDTYSHYKELGVKQICINGLMRKGKGKDLFDARFMVKYINALYQFLCMNCENISITVPPELLKLYSNLCFIFEEEFSDNELIFDEYCNEIVIDYNGEMFYSKTNRYIGNITEKRIEDVDIPIVCRNLTKTECANCYSFDYCKAASYEAEIYECLGTLDFSCCDDVVDNLVFS